MLRSEIPQRRRPRLIYDVKQRLWLHAEPVDVEMSLTAMAAVWDRPYGASA